MRVAQSSVFGNTLKESDATPMQDAFEFLSYNRELNDLTSHVNVKALGGN